MQQMNNGLYNPKFEHDNCGIGAIVNIKGNKDHEAVEQALHIVELFIKIVRKLYIKTLSFL